MEIILLERVEKLGQIGDIVTVKDGFARNYLLPQKKALRATEANKQYFETQKKEIEAMNKKQVGEAEKAAKKVQDAKIVVLRQAGESGQLYGSVTSRDIARALRDQGVKGVRRGNVILDTPIKELGVSKVHIRLHPEVIVDIDVNVARSAEEADSQALEEATKVFESEELAEAAEAELSDVTEEAAEEEVEAEAEAEAVEEKAPAEKAEEDSGEADAKKE